MTRLKILSGMSRSFLTGIHQPNRNFFTTSVALKKVNPSLPNLATDEEASKKTEIKRQFFSRMFEFIGDYSDKVLSTVLPDVAMKAVRTFSNGTKALYGDMKQYTWVNHVLSETSNWQKACKTLTRRQLEIYLYLPGELMRVTPVLVVSAFPMAQNIAFPLAMMFPNRLLSSHFLNDEQLKYSFSKETKQRQSHFRVVLRLLNLMTPRSGHDNSRQILASILNDNSSPNPVAILTLLPLFDKDGPLNVNKLSAPHVKQLMKTNRIRGSILWFPRFRLQQHANIVHQIDLAITREGGPCKLSLYDLRKACHLRGLNVEDQEEAVLIKYLKDWLTTTRKLDANSMSFLLHLPVLLGYNHSSRIWDKWSIH